MFLLIWSLAVILERKMAIWPETSLRWSRFGRPPCTSCSSFPSRAWRDRWRSVFRGAIDKVFPIPCLADVLRKIEVIFQFAFRSESKIDLWRRLYVFAEMQILGPANETQIWPLKIIHVKSANLLLFSVSGTSLQWPNGIRLGTGKTETSDLQW